MFSLPRVNVKEPNEYEIKVDTTLFHKIRYDAKHLALWQYGSSTASQLKPIFDAKFWSKGESVILG